MHYVAYIIAYRYLTRSAYEGAVSTMVMVSFCSIFVGSFSLALITAIMHGFDIETQKTLQGIHAHATIEAHGDTLNLDALEPVLLAEFSNISASAPTSHAHGLLKVAANNAESPTVIMLQAIDPKREIHVSALLQKTQPLTAPSSLRQDGVIIGSCLAAEHAIQIGDHIQLYYADDQATRGNKILFNVHKATVVGCIQTGIDEYDSHMVLCSFDLFNTLFPETGIQELHIRFADNAIIPDEIYKLKKRLSLNVYSWQELYPAIVSALTLEKYVSCIVLALITLVASMNIIALIFMKITAKQTDIAILKAIGLINTDIASIFLIFGFAIVLSATTGGTLCAMVVSWCINHYQCIPLPNAYYVAYVPSHMHWYIPLGVIALVSIVSFLAIWIPARKAKNLPIAQILRCEK
jgi:lipoprotein-releasing system permease protein